MPINTALLVSAPMLQDYFVDKDTGLPLVNGIVTCYQDNARTTLKNWYYQTGTPGNYTYVTLPNPMQLSAVGTIVDVNGNDTIPFFYPYSEEDNSTIQTYYITVQDQNLEAQFVRANFPFIANNGNIPVNQVATDKNYIVNNSFWRNIGSLVLTGSMTGSGSLTNSINVPISSNQPTNNLFYSVVSPSQHDGFIMPDMQFMKNINGSVESITFDTFPKGSNPLVGDITPEYFITHNCQSPALGETQKFYQIPISLHIKQLESVTATITLQAISNNILNPNNIITLYIFQFTGTGTVSPDPVFIQNITLTTAWNKTIITFTFPTAVGTSATSPGDDAYYLQIGMPLSQQCNLSFTLPSVYLSTTVPTNNFTTYDESGAIFDSSRTGDIRVSLNEFYPYGWVPMNDGTIGNSSSMATARKNTDTWQLYSLLYNKFFPYTNGTANPVIQLFNSGGTQIIWSGSAITDFNSNNALSLTKNMARVLLGTVPIDQLLTSYKTTFTASDDGSAHLLITTTNSVNYYTGMTITFSNSGGSLPMNLVANTIYYVANFNGTNSFLVSTTFDNAMNAHNSPIPGGSVIGFSMAGTGTNTVMSALDGSITGQYGHIQTPIELGTHNHGAGAPGTNFIESQAGSFSINLGSGLFNFIPVSNTANAGSSLPFNVTQPGTFNNFYIKL